MLGYLNLMSSSPWQLRLWLEHQRTRSSFPPWQWHSTQHLSLQSVKYFDFGLLVTKNNNLTYVRIYGIFQPAYESHIQPAPDVATFPYDVPGNAAFVDETVQILGDTRCALRRKLSWMKERTNEYQ